MYKIFEQLCKEKGVTAYKVCKATGITTATISNWKAGRYTPKQEKMQKISDYFGVSLTYLMTGKEENKKRPEQEQLTEKDEKDIAKELDAILDKLDSDDSLMFDSDEFDDETREYLKKSLEVALTNAKIMAKEKFVPKKYK